MKSTEFTPKEAMSAARDAQRAHGNMPKQTEEVGFWERLEFYRVAIVVATLAAVGCLGGIMALYAISMPIGVLITGVCFSMVTLSLVIGMAPARWILPMAVVTVLVDLGIILAALFG